MRARYRTALAVLVIAIVAWLGKEALQPREPSYQGKRLSASNALKVIDPVAAAKAGLN
jgi:hypothetical protein